jgi:hypothetical protein
MKSVICTLKSESCVISGKSKKINIETQELTVENLGMQSEDHKITMVSKKADSLSRALRVSKIFCFEKSSCSRLGVLFK